jgi:hypothetical protein
MWRLHSSFYRIQLVRALLNPGTLLDEECERFFFHTCWHAWESTSFETGITVVCHAAECLFLTAESLVQSPVSPFVVRIPQVRYSNLCAVGRTSTISLLSRNVAQFCLLPFAIIMQV